MIFTILLQGEGEKRGLEAFRGFIFGKYYECLPENQKNLEIFS